MKKIFVLIALIFVSLTGIYAMNQKTDMPPATDRTVIDKLWKEYDAARTADRPQKQMDILGQIKKLASDQRLPWDYYDACDKYRSAGISRNWKLADSLNRQFQREIKEFDEPVVTFYNDSKFQNPDPEFISKNKEILESARNAEFYTAGKTPSYLPVKIAKYIENDYQYTLWTTLMRAYLYSEGAGKCLQMLQEVISGKYPAEALLEYMLITKRTSGDSFRQKEELQKYLDAHKSESVSFLARQELLRIKFNELTADKLSTSDQFRKLRSDCVAFENDRKSFSGKEKTLASQCKEIDGLLKTLDRKNIIPQIKDGTINVLTRNVNNVDVRIIRDDRTVASTALTNNVRSYFVRDTLTYRIPALDDGDYRIEFKYDSEKATISFRKYSLAIAQKKDATGLAIYLADALTGEPVKNADIELVNQNDKVVTQYKNLELDGFTYLPAEFTRHLNADSWKNSIRCSFKGSDGLVHKTETIRIQSAQYIRQNPSDITYGQVYLDRTSFNPDETVHFKAVVYHGDMNESLKTVGEGKTITAKLFDAEDNEISSQKLTTNEFGSVAGEFVLERRSRNGHYLIAIYDTQKNSRNPIGSESLRVDDFVLPTFDLKFDPDKELHFPGDEVKVTGNVKSFSGHSLSAAGVRYSVQEGGRVVKEGELNLDADGRFEIPFIAKGNDDYLYFNISVTVTDATGETQSWSTGRSVQKHIPFSAELLNKAEATISVDRHREYRENEFYAQEVVSDDIIKIKLHTDPSLETVRKSLKISYRLSSDGKTVAEGSSAPGDVLELNTAAFPSGLYTFEAIAKDTDAYGNELQSLVCCDIFKVKDEDTVLNFDTDVIYKVVEGEGIAVQIGSTAGPVWACVEIYGDSGKLLGSKMVHFNGKKDVEGSLTTVSFDWPAGQKSVFLHVIYFKNYSQHSYSHVFDRKDAGSSLPLSFTRFEDRTAPGTAYSFEISTHPDVECAAAIFDKSTESIQSNRWHGISLYSNAPWMNYAVNPGSNGDFANYIWDDTLDGDMYGLEETVVVGYGSSRRLLSKAAAPAPMAANSMAGAVMDYAAEVEEETMAYEAAPSPMPDGADITVRDNFANTIAFEPFLRSDEAGKIILDFTTADKLSTYYVQLFAHDKDMNNSVLRKEMLVTIPVKVSVVEPQFLFEGDKYKVKASLASSIEKPVSGYLKADFFDGKDYKSSTPLKTLVRKVELGSLESLSCEFEIDVPAVKELGILLTYIADEQSSASDAVFVSVPVSPAVQTLTESHSSILHSGESLESLLAGLKAEFVNTSADGAEIKDISVLQMVRDAIPSKVEASSDNVIALSEAVYVRLLAEKLGSNVSTTVTTGEIVDKILACRRGDGGFAWFESMESSPVVTATLLQRYASLRKRGLIEPSKCSIPVSTVQDAVKYLDKTYFGDGSRPYWCGGLSREQYISTRAMFPEVPFSDKGVDAKVIKQFRKDMKEYLTPAKERGLEGYILGKARRMRILLDLSASEEGNELANSWGVVLGTGSKLLKSLQKDLLSIEEYAIGHRSGGWYYPNAVMPFRGLLESEAYAHAFIADLLKDCAPVLEGTAQKESIAKAMEIADGIRLWLMVQKETQKWDEDAAFVDALSTILDASENVLDLRVVSLTKTFTKPLAEVIAAGNGFTIERKFFVEKTDGSEVTKVDLVEGDILNVGDKVIAEYRIWNEENRSFVKVTVPRPASLRPVEQLSGGYGWWMKPLSVSGWVAFTPHGYRSVLKDRTEYWFDSYPEEKTTITEEFFVTQAGSFQTGAVEVESLYAPHYRANENGRNAIVSE